MLSNSHIYRLFIHVCNNISEKLKNKAEFWCAKNATWYSLS